MKNTPCPNTSHPEIVEPGANADPVFGETIAEDGGQRVFYVGPQKAWTHRIYARCRNKGRYYALNVRTGRTVGNLIYATMFDQGEATRAIEKLRTENPDWEFKIRKISSAPS